MVATSLVPRLLCVGGRKEPGTHCLRMLTSLNFWGFGNFRKICSVILTSVRHANFV